MEIRFETFPFQRYWQSRLIRARQGDREIFCLTDYDDIKPRERSWYRSERIGPAWWGVGGAERVTLKVAKRWLMTGR